MLCCAAVVQSNMQFSLNTAFNGSTYIASASEFSRSLRLLTVRRTTAKTPSADAVLDQRWSVSSPAAVNDNKTFGIFSAECFLTGRKLLQMRPNVPIGLISSCWRCDPTPTIHRVLTPRVHTELTFCWNCLYISLCH